jgi:hypothetical protein
MSTQSRVEKLEKAERRPGYDLTALTDDELLALWDCYTDDGDYLEERMTAALSARLASIKL